MSLKDFGKNWIATHVDTVMSAEVMNDDNLLLSIIPVIKDIFIVVVEFDGGKKVVGDVRVENLGETKFEGLTKEDKLSKTKIRIHGYYIKV